jgi:hypothetical protein
MVPYIVQNTGPSSGKIYTLMIALGVIMGPILRQDIPQRRLAYDDHTFQRFFFDRTHEPLAVRIQIGTARG